MERTVAMILGGGRGTRLYPLTKLRSKPAVPFGGMYRLIDIPISNSINSGIYRMFVLTQFNSASLNRHLALTYTFDTFRQGFVTVLAAEQTHETMDWYQGTADAVRKNLRHLRPFRAEDVLVLSGDHIYRMDYQVMIAFHRQQRADVTIGVIPIPSRDMQRFGILRVGSDGRVTDFHEKPNSPDAVKGWSASPGMFNQGTQSRHESFYMGSMGIYVIRTEALSKILDPAMGEDFGKDVLPKAISRFRVYAYPFTGYWEDIGTIQSFYDANLALTDDEPKYELFDSETRLFTRPRYLPGARLGEATVHKTLICPGVRAGAISAERSIIGARAIVGGGASIRDSYVVGADYYETSAAVEENRELKRPDVGIGGETSIHRAIIDKNARIGYGVTIDPPSDCPDMDGKGYAVRDGIVIVEKSAVIPDGSILPELG
ncbi:glucose-1-phosphate adenylyltransferase [bacterium]|nr:glucose-1-phosphate adenylyltransferase [bacterium]MBU1984575.1 glucose-1-phosphate adenylyltransferase [bacterium]